MSLNAYALTTVARLKTFIGVTSTDYDTLLESIINSVSDFVENYCGRRFKKTTYTQEYYDGNDAETLNLEQYPVISTETFTLERRDSTLNEDDWSTVDTENYYIKYEEGIISYIKGLKFAKYPKHYRVTYAAGYDFDNATSYLSTVGAGDLEMIVWKLCNSVYSQRKGDPSVESERLLNYSVKYSKKVFEDDEIKAILDKYAKLSSLGGYLGG